MARNPASAPVHVEHYIEELGSANERVRFAAAKALSGFRSGAADGALQRRIEDGAEHIFIRLEAAASLARHGYAGAWRFFETTLDDSFAENRLECCIVLAEVKEVRAQALLVSKLSDEHEHPDVRAGAAWAIGEHRSPQAFGALAAAFTARPEGIRVEAARALAKLAREHKAEAIRWFSNVTDAERPGMAFALRKGAQARADDLRIALQGEDARQWAAYIVGTSENLGEVEKLKDMDREVYFAATLLWKMLSSGIYSLEEYG